MKKKSKFEFPSDTDVVEMLENEAPSYDNIVTTWYKDKVSFVKTELPGTYKDYYTTVRELPELLYALNLTNETTMRVADGFIADGRLEEIIKWAASTRDVVLHTFGITPERDTPCCLMLRVKEEPAYKSIW